MPPFILESSVPGLRFFCPHSWLLILLFIRHILRLTTHDSSIVAAVVSAGWELKTLSLVTASLEALHSYAPPPRRFLETGIQRGRSQDCGKIGHHLGYVCRSYSFILGTRTSQTKSRFTRPKQRDVRLSGTVPPPQCIGRLADSSARTVTKHTTIFCSLCRGHSFLYS
jgi:hypothetical protein